MKEAENAFGKLARVEPGLLPDPDQFSPGFRNRFEEVKARVRGLPRRKLAITAVGVQGSVFVNGKPMGTTPVTVTLPTGSYRIGGAAGSLHVPSFRVDLDQEDRTVVLDFALAASLRMNAGPGLALAPADRGAGVIRAGAWLGVDKLVVVSRSEEGQAQFLVGGIYDVLRGALLREGSVRMVAGGVPSVNLSALAAFLLTGQSSREVKDLSRDAPKRALSPVAAVQPGMAATPPAATAVQPPPAASERVPTVPAAPVTSPPSPVAATARPPPAAPAAKPSPQVAPPAPVSVAVADALKEPSSGARPQLDARLALGVTQESASPIKIADADKDSRPSGGTNHWMGPSAIGAGVLAVGLAGLALQQNAAATRAYSEAEDQLQSDGTFKNAEAQARWNSLRSEGQRERRTAAISAGAAVASP